MLGPQLPLELKAAIINEIVHDKNSLLLCRLASRALNVLATPHTFQILNMSRTRGSCSAFKALSHETEVFRHVKEINFRALQVKDMIFEGDTVEETAFFFSSVSKFSNLRTLRLYFPPVFEEEHKDEFDDIIPPMSPNRTLQIAIFNALTNLDPKPNFPLHTLEIHGLLALCNEGIRSPRFSPLLHSLHTLLISVVTNDRDEFEMQYDDDYIHFWKTDMHSLLTRTAQNLTSLTLNSDINTSAFAAPNSEWHTLTLPKLQSLTLRKLVFTSAAYFAQQWPEAASDGLEEFIVRHWKTLVHLELSSCCVEIGEQDAHPRVWADIWSHFRKHLIMLRCFEFHPLPKVRNRQLGWEGDEEDDGCFPGYVWFFIETGYIHSFDGPPSDEDEDVKAFEALQVAIKSRNKT